MYIFCIHVLYIYLYFYISIYIYIILYLHLYHSISTSIYLQGHLGGHWLLSISINHPFQILGTITFKSLNLPCSIKYFSEPSLSAWVRAAQSREEQQWQLGPQGPQDRGGDWGGGLRDGSSSGAAGREMGSASDLVVFFWLWFLSFMIWSFCWFLFWTWSMFFFFNVFTCWIFPGGPRTSIQNVQHRIPASCVFGCTLLGQRARSLVYIQCHFHTFYLSPEPNPLSWSFLSIEHRIENDYVMDG